jgi:hypothetical protein
VAVILPGLGEGRSATWLSAAIVLGLLVSRLALVPDGPWEQDEALFATGVLDFDVVHHRPHPPGFPGWIAIGKILAPLTGDALLALRIASSLASVVIVIALAHLLAKLVDGGSALLAAIAYGFAPVTWAHAPRAFSDTPALACIVTAIWLWTSRRSSLGAWALLGVAATIRAQLAPELAIVALLGIAIDRRRPRRLALGIAIAIAIVSVAYGAAALDADSPTAYWQAVTSHLGRHESDVAAELAWADLGFVRGLGGSIPAAIACGLVLAGCGLALGRDRRLGAWLLALFLATAYMVLERHHPGFPRYAVSLVLAGTPFAVIAVTALPRPLPTVALAIAFVVGALATLPTMLAMHRAPLPPVAALRSISAGEPTRVVYSHGQFSFVRYHALSGELDVPIDDVDSPESIPLLPRGAYALSGRTLHFLPGATVCIERFDDFPAKARALSQERFDSAEIARDAILLGVGVHRPERTPAGEPFAWLSGEATLHVPGPSSTVVLQLRTPSRQRIEAHIGDAVVLAQTELDKGSHTLRIPVRGCDEGCALRLLLPDARTSNNDRRRLSLRVESAWSEGPSVRGAHQRWSPGDPASMRKAGVVIAGAHEPEEFGERPGVWTHARFTATFPASAGTLVLHVARPPHTPGAVVFTSEAETKEVEVGRDATAVDLRIDPIEGSGRLEIVTPTFVPREVDPASTDGRELGLILFDVEYVPDDDPCGAHE